MALALIGGIFFSANAEGNNKNDDFLGCIYTWVTTTYTETNLDTGFVTTRTVHERIRLCSSVTVTQE